jgi:hypothetical protein
MTTTLLLSRYANPPLSCQSQQHTDNLRAGRLLGVIGQRLTSNVFDLSHNRAAADCSGVRTCEKARTAAASTSMRASFPVMAGFLVLPAHRAALAPH